MARLEESEVWDATPYRQRRSTGRIDLLVFVAEDRRLQNGRNPNTPACFIPGREGVAYQCISTSAYQRTSIDSVDSVQIYRRPVVLCWDCPMRLQ